MPFGFECLPFVDVLDRELSLHHVDLRFKFLFVLGITIFYEISIEKLNIPNFMYLTGQLDVLFYVVDGARINFKVLPNLTKINIVNVHFAIARLFAAFGRR